MNNNKLQLLITLLISLISIEGYSRNITSAETISANETVENITLGNGVDITINAGITLTVTGSISLGEQSDISGSGILALNGSSNQTITLTSSGWYSTSAISTLKMGNYNVTISKGANRQIQITTINYNCKTSTINTSELSNTPTETNKPPTAPGTITSNSPQCPGTGITFTKGSCPGSSTCYWVSSANGTETSNSSNTYTTATTAGTYYVWVRAYNGTCWSAASSSSGTIATFLTISSHPSTSSQSVCKNSSSTALSVIANGCSSLNYQWYSNNANSNSGGTLISGANTSSYTPPTNTEGTVYYYCVITDGTNTVTSNVSGAIITRPLPTATASASPNPVYTNEILYLTGGPNGMASYAWTGPNGFSSSLQNPTLSGFSTSAAGVYSITTTNVYGCTASANTSSVTVNTATTYYSKSTGNLNSTASWGTNTDGTGTAPTNFTTSGQTFIIQNNATPTIGANWTVSGVGSKVIVGNGTNACNFSIPASFSFTGIIDVRNNATLTISNNSVPTLSILYNGSTVIFNSSGAQTIPANNYYNLTIGGARTGSPTITLASGTISCSGTYTLSYTGTVNFTTTNNTFTFDGTGDQNIPAFTYNNLHTELGGTKTLTGNITVKDKLRIGAISKLSQGNYNITLQGSGSIVTLVGTFIPGTSNTDGQSTVYYTSASNATVAAMNYRNLDLGTGPRTFQETNIISVSRTFTPGSGLKTVTNSTFSFNGSAAQTCPAFTFYNLEIANTTSNGGVTLSGNIIVQNLLTLHTGLLTTTASYSVHVTNTSYSAVSIGTSSSYVNGKLTRSFVSNLSSQTNEYFFPVGNYSSGHNYLPFTVKNITTGATAPTLTAQAVVGANAATASTGLTAVSTSEYWAITYTGNFTSGVISLTKTSGLGSYNAIGHRSTAGGSTGAYTSIKGSVQGTTTIFNSNVTTFSFFVLGTRSTAPATYYYRGSGDIHNVANWTTSSNGVGGTSPTNFTSDDVTYIVTNTSSVSLTANFAITGANTNIQIGNGSTTTTLTVPNGYTLSNTGNISFQRYGSLIVNNGGTVTTNANIVFATPYANGQSITNSGTINIAGNLTMQQGSFATINNNATGIINLLGDFHKDQNTWFYNAGLFSVTNGNFTTNNNFQNVFENQSGGYVLIDNTNAPNKSVTFTNLNFSEGFDILEGSTLKVVNSNVNFTGGSIFDVAGDFIVENGNLKFNAGGSTINVTSTGGLYVYDTNNSGDGIVDFSDGGIGFNVTGIAYVEGLTVANGGGTSISIPSGGEMFVGNIGLYTGFNNNTLTVNPGGTLNYCGNKTSGADQLGFIDTNGLLNYALGYYTTQTPGSQNDFNVVGNQTAAYENSEACRAAFYNGTPLGEELLPIELTMLHATCSNGTIHIAWQTASEQNNDFFTVYRSFDGIVFTAIATVSGAGNSNSLLNYMYDDNTLAQGIVYYKLAQTDYDGTTVYSKILAVSTCGNPAIYSFKEGEIDITFENKDIPNHVIITSIDGKILFSKVFIHVESASIATSFASGVYIVSTIGNKTIISEKFVVN